MRNRPLKVKISLSPTKKGNNITCYNIFTKCNLCWLYLLGKKNHLKNTGKCFVKIEISIKGSNIKGCYYN